MKDLDRKQHPAVRRLLDLMDPIGYLLTELFHLLGLFAIGGATVWAAAKAFLEMATKGHASIEDLLLLFIYLEIGSMVGIYFRTKISLQGVGRNGRLNAPLRRAPAVAAEARETMRYFFICESASAQSGETSALCA